MQPAVLQPDPAGLRQCDWQPEGFQFQRVGLPVDALLRRSSDGDPVASGTKDSVSGVRVVTVRDGSTCGKRGLFYPSEWAQL